MIYEDKSFDSVSPVPERHFLVAGCYCCAVCEEPFKVGDEVEYGDGDDFIVHRRCVGK